MSGARISQPHVTFTNVPARVKISTGPQAVLMVGVMNDAGTATAGELVHIPNDNSYKALFGNSMLSDMIAAFKQTNPVTTLDVIGVEVPTGAAATSNIVIDNNATENGTISFYVGSNDNVVTATILTTDDNEGMANKIKAAFDAKSDFIVSAGVSTNTVTLTYRYHGTEGNQVGLRVVNNTPGVAVTINPFASGAGALNLADVFDVVKKERYQTVVWPFPESMDVVKDFLEPRWNVTNNVLDGVSITALLDTHSNALATLSGMNEKTAVMIVNGTLNTPTNKGGDLFETPPRIAAAVGAFRSLRYTKDALLTQYLTTSAGKDQFGGPALGALPYFNTLFPYLPTLDKGVGFTEIEVEELAAKGGTVLGNNKTGTDIILGEVHTTYKTDPAGNPDPTYKYLNSVDVQSIAREYFYVNIAKRFAQSRLTEGGIFEGRDMANEGVIRSFTIGLYKDLAGGDYVIVQSGPAQIEFFDDNLFIDLDLVEGKISIEMKCCFVSQARTFIGTLEYVFSIN